MVAVDILPHFLKVSHSYSDQKNGNHVCSICGDSKGHDVEWTDLHNGNHSGNCKYCEYTVESEEHIDLDPVDEKCDKCGGQIGLPYEHKNIDDLVANPPTDTEIYIVEGIWQHNDDRGPLADDVYGNGFLYDPISGNKIEHYGMAESEEAFKAAYDSSANKFTNPKTFKDTKTQFEEGDQIQLGVVYDSSHSNYYSFFIKRTEVKANIYYSATTDFNSEGGTVTIDNANALLYGQSVEIKITVTDGYKVSSVKHNDTPIAENGGKYTFTVVPGPNKISVTFVEDTGEPEVKAWRLVTNASDLAVGDKIIIVAADSAVAMSTTQNTNNRGQVTVVKNSSDKTLTFTTSVEEFTLQKGNKDNTFALVTHDNKYLAAASNSKNNMHSNSTLDNESSWKITITSAGVATITAQGDYTHNVLKYNSNSSLFSCYASGQQNVSIYKLS